MALTRLYDRDSTQTSPGTKLDADLDQTNNAVNAHLADTTAHGGTGAVVGTTNTQTLTNKTLTTPTISGIKKAGLNREAVTTTATVAVDTVIVAVTTLSAALTVTIPTAQITAIAGRLFIIKDETGTAGATYNITIATEGSETIDGLATLVIDEPYGSITLYSNATNLFIA